MKRGLWSSRMMKRCPSAKRCFQAGLILIWLLLSPFIVEVIDGIFQIIFWRKTARVSSDYLYCVKLLWEEPGRRIIFMVSTILFLCALVLMLYRIRPDIGKGATREVATGIWIPIEAGSGQYGTARFLTRRELEKEFTVADYRSGSISGLSRDAGLIVDYEPHGERERICYLDTPVNAIILGATRSGKTRRLLMPSTWLGLRAGVNMLIVDVKGEQYAFTYPFAQKMGYEIWTLDFRYPEKSMHYNFLADIVACLVQGQISAAVEKAWDVVTILVGEPKGEPIWANGECATIAAAILIIANDAPQECKNLTNVYYFLAYMCEPDPQTGEMPITDYLQKLPASHPAKGAFQVAQIAPLRTRSSFFTSALATLRLFTAWNVADITRSSDYSFGDIDEKKVIIYLILPDEKTTYHPLGALYMKMCYESLVAQALKNGGRLHNRFIFRADEIGNFPCIPDFGTMLSAGAGRNIFFELVLQDYQQLERRYKEDCRNIRTNCQLTVCLKVTDEQTTQAISKQLGNYTIQVNSASTSVSDGRGDMSNYAKNTNLAGRPLLFPDEIASMQKPDALVLYDGKKVITNLPDLSSYAANGELGLGDESANADLFLRRMAERPCHEIGPPELWDVWEKQGLNKAEIGSGNVKVSFL